MTKKQYVKDKIQSHVEEIWSMEIVIAFNQGLDTDEGRKEMEKAKYRIDTLELQIKFLEKYLKTIK